VIIPVGEERRARLADAGRRSPRSDDTAGVTGLDRYDMSSPRTVRLARGDHRSPEEGVCVMELASMLAEEPFTHRPRSVCPVVAAFLRTYNDQLRHVARQELYPYAALVLDSRRDPDVARRRAAHFLAWASGGRCTRRQRLLATVRAWDDVTMWWVGRRAAQLARDREAQVRALLEDVLAIGTPAAPTAPEPAPHVIFTEVVGEPRVSA